jgi:hypothetical protein
MRIELAHSAGIVVRDSCKFTVEWMDNFTHISARFETEGLNENARPKTFLPNFPTLFPCRLGAKAVNFSFEFTITKHDKLLQKRLSQETLSQCAQLRATVSVSGQKRLNIRGIYH